MTKLLIVDDEPLTVDMLQTFLQINGYETIGAFNGEDGLVMVQVEQPEMMILDLMLPDIEGFEVCRRIRTLPDFARHAGIPVLVLSARIEESSRKRAMEVGANAYLTKPVRFPDLLAELRRLVINGQVIQPATNKNESALASAPMPSPTQDHSVVAASPEQPAQPADNQSGSENPPSPHVGTAAATPAPAQSHPVVGTLPGQPIQPAGSKDENPPAPHVGAAEPTPRTPPKQGRVKD